MQYEIPTKYEEVLDLCQKPIDEELVAIVIAGIVRIAKANDYSIKKIADEIMSEDPFLDPVQRRWLCEIFSQAWDTIPFQVKPLEIELPICAGMIDDSEKI